MKKAKLLKLKQMHVSEDMIQLARNDTGENERIIYGYGRDNPPTARVYKYYRFYQAEVEDEMLKVAIYTRRNIVLGQQLPDFTIFFDKENEEWITYEYAEKRWLKAMIFNLPYNPELGERFGSYGWCSESDTKVINEYLGTEGEARNAIRLYQAEKRKNELYKKHRSEMDEIDEFMETVPELPKDFKKWVEKSAYKNYSYIIMQPGKIKEGYCTFCSNYVPIKVKPKHNATGKCPKCRAEVEYKSFGKQYELHCDKKVGIVQKTTDRCAYVLRIFNSKMIFKRNEDYLIPHLSLYEVFRFRLDGSFNTRESFEYGEYRNEGITRWCHELNHGYGYGWYYGISTDCILYENNLDKILEDTDGKYVPLKSLLKKNKGKRLDTDEALRTCVRRPEIEKVIKIGLTKLSFNMLDRYINEINYNAIKVEDMLRLNKEYMRQAVSMNVDKDELRILQAAYREKVILTPELVYLLDDFYGGNIEDIQIVLRRGNIEKMLHYLEKVSKERNVGRRTVGVDYNDYLEQLAELQMPINKHTRFPANFYQTHERLSEMIREKDEKIEKADVKKKNRELKKVVDEWSKLYYGDSEDFVIVWPKNKADFQLEGQLQHNCVGGYFERMVKRKTTVFFLRHTNEPKEPFCTVEFTNGELIQCRTKFNKDAPEEAMEFMKVIKANYDKEMLKRAGETLVMAAV